jgi:hypothetical protein
VAHAAQNLRRVLLDLHSPAAPVAPLPPPQFPVDQLDLDRHTRRQTFDYRDQRAPMRLSGSVKTKHKEQ